MDFRFYKHATVSRRIARRMMLAKIGSLEEYVQFLKESPVEAVALANDIFIHVTGFLKDPECFQALRKQLFRHLRKRSTEVLQQSVSTLRALIESSPQAILAVSGDGKITQANAITEKVFGSANCLDSPSRCLSQKTLEIGTQDSARTSLLIRVLDQLGSPVRSKAAVKMARKS